MNANFLSASCTLPPFPPFPTPFPDPVSIITGADGKLYDWGDDFLRCFRRNPAEFVNRADFADLPAEGKSFLKQLLSDPDVGNIWKLPERDVDEWWKKYWIRGTITELEMWHTKYLKDGFRHVPIAPPEGVDFIHDAKKIAVQLKSVMTKNSTSVQRMKDAVDAMRGSPSVPSSYRLQMEILMKPGADTAGMKAALQDYVNQFGKAVSDRFDIKVIEHGFGTP